MEEYEYQPCAIEETCDGVYKVYLLNEIKDPSNYVDLMSLLTDSETHYVEFYINTLGGVSDTAEMLYHAIVNSDVATTAYLSGTVASAGTIIGLACDNVYINDTTVFMVHDQEMDSLSGKASDLLAYQTFMSKRNKEFFNTVYKSVLSSKEIGRVLNGEQLWFTGKEINERLKQTKE